MYYIASRISQSKIDHVKYLNSVYIAKEFVSPFVNHDAGKGKQSYDKSRYYQIDTPLSSALDIMYDVCKPDDEEIQMIDGYKLMTNIRFIIRLDEGSRIN